MNPLHIFTIIILCSALAFSQALVISQKEQLDEANAQIDEATSVMKKLGEADDNLKKADAALAKACGFGNK